MKTVTILFLVFAGLAFARAADPPKAFDKLETLSGNKFEKVVVTKIEPDGIRIEHSAGMGKVKFKDLPKDVAAAFHYDAAEAEEFAEKKRQEQEDAAEEVKDAVAASRAESARLGKKVAKEAAKKAFAKKLDSLAVMVDIRAFQNSSIGLIGTARAGRVTSWAEKPGSMADTVPVWTYGGPVDAVLSGFVEATHTTSTSEYGFVDRYFEWKGKAWAVGNITYTTILGEERTVKHYTGSRLAAEVYYSGGRAAKGDPFRKASP